MWREKGYIYDWNELGGRVLVVFFVQYLTVCAVT